MPATQNDRLPSPVPQPLSRYAKAMEAASVTAFHERMITSATDDSRKVTPGTLFVAVRGVKRDGHAFLAEAIGRGAAAVAVEPRALDGVTSAALLSAGVPVIHVADTRAALARSASLAFGRPGREMRLLAVTGTNGKTTTATLLAGALNALGEPCAQIGTTGNFVAGQTYDTAHTTPHPWDLHRFLSRARYLGARAAAMEVSSHALDQRRVEDLPFAAAVFTNLTRDHLDYHGDMERYAQAKALLFAGLGVEATAVLNADDPAWTRFAAVTTARVVTTSVDHADEIEADYRATDLTMDGGGSRFVVRAPGGEVQARTPLVGRYNVANALGVIAALHSLGRPLEAVVAALASLRGARGRLEPVDAGQPFTCLVDYAHTPDALEKALRCVRDLTAGRVITVFGCGGDRDRAKRPMMGAIARRLSDVTVVTSDNPRSERPENIIAEILAGAGGSSPAADLLVIPDRRAAIEAALGLAAPGDLVLVAGKGHETCQIVGAETLPFDDAQVIRETLAPPTPARKAG